MITLERVLLELTSSLIIVGVRAGIAVTVFGTGEKLALQRKIGRIGQDGRDIGAQVEGSGADGHKQ
jgi:hypothetical protein